MINRPGFKIVIFAVLVLVFSEACQHQPEISVVSAKGSGGTNTPHQQTMPYLILISIDGFRWDYLDRYATPNMDRLVANGSRAERLVPVFPTLTFPNHYSIATGLYPANHGLVANNFPDPDRNMWYSLKNRQAVEDSRFYAGEPIWVTAEKQGMVSASFFWVGSEAPIQGVSPTHWRRYDKGISGEERVDQILAWLAEPEETRPHMYTLYFENVDDHSHWTGPESVENIEAISQVDGYLGRLLDGLEKLPHAEQVNIILVSDHGQTSHLQNEQPFILNDHVNIDTTTVIEGGSYLFLHFDQDDSARAREMVETVNEQWNHGRAYLPGETPGQWQVDDNPRFPDVILIPEPGHAVISSFDKIGKISAGAHGWAPEAPAMHGIFIASGPNINRGISLGEVNVVDIYPLMLSILGLDAPENIDGDAGKLAGVLSNPETEPGFSSGLYKRYPRVIWFPEKQNPNQ